MVGRWRLGLGGVVAAVLLSYSIVPLFALDPQDFTVQVSAIVQAVPAQITLQWPTGPFASSYVVSRKLVDAQQWDVRSTLPGSATTFSDSNVVLGAAYEYQVQESQTDGTQAYGYIYAGIQVPFPGSRGRAILVVDSTYSADL